MTKVVYHVVVVVAAVVGSDKISICCDAHGRGWSCKEVGWPKREGGERQRKKRFGGLWRPKLVQERKLRDRYS